MTLLRRRAALDAWIAHAEALLLDHRRGERPEPEAAPDERPSDAA